MFIFGEHKLSFYISTVLWLRKYDVFDFPFDHTTEVSRDLRDHVVDVSYDFEDEISSSWATTLQSLGSAGLVKVEI